MDSLTTDNTLRCSYCSHDLSDASSVTYIDGQPVCAMCLARMEGLRKGKTVADTWEPPYYETEAYTYDGPPLSAYLVGSESEDKPLVASGILDERLAQAKEELLAKDWEAEDWEQELAEL